MTITKVVGFKEFAGKAGFLCKMVIANNSRNREPAISIVVLKLPTVKGKRDSNIFLLVFEILNCYNLDKFNPN